MKQNVLDAKKAVVEEIAGKLQNSASAVVVEYRGLTVAEVTELRRQLRAESIDFKVYKNSMVSRAAEAANLEGLNETLVGPNAFAFGTDAVAPARILAEFAKKHKALVIKAGYVEGKFLPQEEVIAVSKLPNREGMYSMLLCVMKEPVSKVARAIKAVADARGEAAPAAEEVAA